MATLYALSALMAEVDVDGDGQQLGIETVFAAIIIIGAVIAAIVAIVKVFGGTLMRGREQSKRLDRFFDDWYGEEARPSDGIEARPGVLMRLHQLEGSQATLRELDRKFDDLADKVDTVAAKVNHELTNNHGTSTKDGVDMAVKLATAALTTVQDIQRKQDEQNTALKAWQDRYSEDQQMTRAEWVAVFDAIRDMIPLTPEDQVPFWDRIAEAYATKTLISQDDNTETA